MPGFNGTGPRGMGPMTGRGMGNCAIPLSTPVEELDYLKVQAQAMRRALKQIEVRIKEVEKPRSAITKE